MAQFQVVLLFCAVFTVFNAKSKITYVRPNSEYNASCPSQPCLTFNEYAEAMEQYTVDNTTFIFLPGYHHLNLSLRIENTSGLEFHADDNATQVLFDPLANITWADCDTLKINNLVFVLSGNFDTQTHFSALVFIRASCVLSNLLLVSNSTLQSTAIRTAYSQVNITNLTVIGARSLLGAALTTYKSTITFSGQNLFVNNTAAQGGAMSFAETVSIFYGNNSFYGNTALLHFTLFAVGANGGAILCINSAISFNGSSTFYRNEAVVPEGLPLPFGTGGAIAILGTSRVMFEQTADTVFYSNTALFKGGAISIDNSELSLQGEVLFENNVNRAVGGAIASSNSTIYCIGKGILFINNRAKGHGGAILASISKLYLHHTNFTGNMAQFGGAVMFNNGTSLRITSCEFMNNVASGQSSAVYIDSSNDVVFDGVNHFEGNQADQETVSCFESTAIIGGMSFFINNSNNHGSSGFSLISSNILMDGTSVFYNNYGAYSGGIHGLLSNISITGNSSFISNTVQLYGGGLFVTNSTLVLNGLVWFSMNSAGNSGSALYARSSYVAIGGIVTIEKCHGIAEIWALQGSIGLLDSEIVITGYLTVSNNSAYEGGGIRVKHGTVDVQGCVQFLNNSAYKGGCIHASVNSTVILSGNCTLFHSNMADGGGAIEAIDSSIILSGSQRFTSNSAEKGGVLALFGSSKLILDEYVSVDFVDNHASSVGGVIFFADTISVSQCSRSFGQEEPTCFLELNAESNIQLNFTRNTAADAGTLFYGGRFDRCRLYVGGGRIDNCGNRIGGNYRENPIDTIQQISSIVAANTSTSNISSDPLQICQCTDNSLDCSQPREIETIRGKSFTLMVVVVGQHDGVVPTSVRTSLENDIKVSPSQRIQSTGKECTPITYQLSSDKDSIKLVLFPDGPCRDTGDSRTEIDITFLPCPDGFTLEGSDCVCEERLQRYTTNCSVDVGYIARDANTFWMGTIYVNESYGGLILHSSCPFDYCTDAPVLVKLNDLDIQCAHDHSGTLCGACKTNYSIALGTLHCLPCSNAYVALILPFALAGVALVAVIILLNLSVATGTINGLIFYANTVQANSSVFFPQGRTNILTVFIAWLNLDLGIETCFYDGMNTYAFTWLQYLFPFYVWFLIGLIIVISRYSHAVANALGRGKPVATLATLFLLSYSKILRTVIVALTSTRLEYPEGSNKLVWLYDGNVPYFERVDHILLGVFSVFVLLFLFIPYTLLLLCGGWIQAHSHWLVLSWINKIKPFMDDHYAPFRKETRYWPGFLLLVRCALLLTFAFNVLGYASVNLLAITTVSAGLASIAWIHNRIYNKLHNDILEASFFFNLCIFSVATYHVKETGGSQVWAANISVGVAFVTFLIILLYHVYLHLQKTALWQKMTKLNLREQFDIRKDKEKHQNQGLSEDRRGDVKTLPTISVIELDLCEPLLEI